MTTGFENLSASQKTRAALHRDVRAICTETCHFLGLEVTKPAMEIIAELVYKKLSVYGSDLEAFAKHAKRATISSEDVKLLARRNPSLTSRLNAIAPSNPTAVKDKRRKTTVPVTKQAETTIADEETNRTKVTNALESNLTETKRDEELIDEDMEKMITDVTIDLTFD